MPANRPKYIMKFNIQYLIAIANTIIYNYWPSKSDFAPVRGDGYEPGSLK